MSYECQVDYGYKTDSFAQHLFFYAKKFPIHEYIRIRSLPCCISTKLFWLYRELVYRDQCQYSVDNSILLKCLGKVLQRNYTDIFFLVSCNKGSQVCARPSCLVGHAMNASVSCSCNSDTTNKRIFCCLQLCPRLGIWIIHCAFRQIRARIDGKSLNIFPATLRGCLRIAEIGFLIVLAGSYEKDNCLASLALGEAE